MDVRDRALLDLGEFVDLGSRLLPRLQPQEERFLQFKRRLNGLLDHSHLASSRQFLLDYFLQFLPVLLRAMAEHEGLPEVPCEPERALLDEVCAGRQTHLAHSPILFPLNRMALGRVTHAAPALDLGIGNGQNSSFTFADRQLDFGGDVILSNLLEARRRGRHSALGALDMAALPFPDASFLRVYALNCIYHVQEGRARGLAEMARVLAPGGVLALTDVSPFLREMKPLASFFHELGFEQLEAEFERYFLSGYGADGTPGEESYYRAELSSLGFEEIRVEYLLSPRLARIAYLLYDWQAMFNLAAQAELGGERGSRVFEDVYRPMLHAVVAPLLAQDRELCALAGQGGYMVVTARRAGATVTPGPIRLACPACLRPLDTSDSCNGCLRTYPTVEGIPLLTTFHADALRDRQDSGVPRPEG